MNIPEIAINNWGDFIKRAEQLHSDGIGWDAAYAFRGQSRFDWNLIPSLTRMCQELQLNEEASNRVEEIALEEFMGKAQNHISPNTLATTRTFFNWWALMQHHGAPTRLLDWTTSIYVATYFACISDPTSDGCVWVLNPNPLQDEMRSRYEGYTPFHQTKLADFADLAGKPIVDVVHVGHRSNRIAAQQGLFTICRSILGDHGQLIANALLPSDLARYFKIRISASSKQEFAFRLRKMNVFAGSLFPGLDGLAWSVRELVALGDRLVFDAQGEIRQNLHRFDRI